MHLQILPKENTHGRDLVEAGQLCKRKNMSGHLLFLQSVPSAPHPHRVSLQILPMENTHGRDLVEAGQLCERKNGRGVDTNRNWDIDWGKKEKDYNPAEEYPGKAPHRCDSW
jgi:hypothetical protein